MAYYRTLPLSDDRELQAYVIGLVIGDGNLSNPNGRATCLRITCDDKYPKLKKRIMESLTVLFPNNKVGFVKNPRNCSNVYVYSNQLENLLEWKAKGGSKLIQNVSAPAWIKTNPEYITPYLRGLIETDGATYKDRGYPMVIFTTIIENLAFEVKSLMKLRALWNTSVLNHTYTN
ncbi:MAG: LAGLIDADG family homing endonuclease [Candidatus Yanofskybacteria bacterium]|nr:LAGLIDADG family homing endonuclease [Candidatus Yanofskybacteria bacterium]